MIVEKNTDLSIPQQDGSTKRKHLQSIAKQTGKKPAELEVPTVPTAGVFIYNTFYSIKNGMKSYSETISLQDIKLWMDLYDVKLSTDEIEAIQSLDRVLINTLINSQKGKKK